MYNKGIKILTELHSDLNEAANYIIQLFYQTGQKYSCSRSKIGKLLSIVAFVYAKNGYKLFDETIYKYDGCGTAIKEIMWFLDRDIYLKSKYFDNRKYINDDFMNCTNIPEIHKCINNVNDKLKEVTENVFRHFGSFSQSDLGECLNPIVELPQIANEKGEIRLHIISTITCDSFAQDILNSENGCLVNFLLSQKYFEETEEGNVDICKMMEEIRNEAATQAANKKAIENAKNMLNDNLPIEKVAEYSGLSIKNIKELSKEQTL